jgi:heat shock transcription factor
VPYFNQSIQNSSANGTAGGNGNSNAPPLSPNSATAAASAFNLDPALLQTSIGSLLQSPAAAQMFLNSLTHSAQGQALATPRGSVNFGANAPGSGGTESSANHLQNQQNNYFANLGNNTAFDPNASGTGFTPQADPTLALLSPLPNYQALAQNNEALLKSYEDAMAVGADAEKLQEGIDSLVRSLGLQPTDGGGAGQAGYGLNAQGSANVDVNGQAAGMGGMGGTGATGPMVDAQPGDLGFDNDFNVDDFLERLGKEVAEEH